jgi:hypothetical protein
MFFDGLKSVVSNMGYAIAPRTHCQVLLATFLSEDLSVATFVLGTNLLFFFCIRHTYPDFSEGIGFFGPFSFFGIAGFSIAFVFVGFPNFKRFALYSMPCYNINLAKL